MDAVVSVIMPVYKIPEKLLRNSIESVLAQSYENIQVLLIDDGSPDNCGSICDEYAQKDRRVEVIHQANSGVSSARNAGIINSKGEYIVFVDSDDVLKKEMIKTMVKAIEDYGCDFGNCSYSVSGVQQSSQETKQVFLYEKEHELLAIRKSFLFGKRINNNKTTGAPWAKIYRRSIITDNNVLFDTRLPRSQDNEFNFRVMKYVKKCFYIDEELYVYTVFENSAMRKYWKNAYINAKKFMEIINYDILQEDNPDAFKEMLSGTALMKMEDILMTNIMHPENPSSIHQRLANISELLNDSTFSVDQVILKALGNRFSYRNMLYRAIVFKRKYIVFLLCKMKMLIKKIKH